MKETLTLIEKTVFFRSIEVLSRIPTESLAELAARTREIHLDAGDVVFREGDSERGFYFVVEGCLEQRRGRALVRVFGPGHAVGELWLPEGAAHPYTVTATEHSHVLHITREDVIDGILDFPEFGVALSEAFSRRVHALTGRVLELEGLVARLHAALEAAGIEPPDPGGPGPPGAPAIGADEH